MNYQRSRLLHVCCCGKKSRWQQSGLGASRKEGGQRRTVKNATRNLQRHFSLPNNINCGIIHHYCHLFAWMNAAAAAVACCVLRTFFSFYVDFAGLTSVIKKVIYLHQDYLVLRLLAFIDKNTSTANSWPQYMMRSSFLRSQIQQRNIRTKRRSMKLYFCFFSFCFSLQCINFFTHQVVAKCLVLIDSTFERACIKKFVW